MDLSLFFPGAPDADSSSAYKIERTLDNEAWNVLEASQAATFPYVSVSTTLAAICNYQAATIQLTDATSVSASGHGYIDNEAMIEWASKDGNVLEGVIWHSGYGAYVIGSSFVEAHETYVDSEVTVGLGVALYRITHINSDGLESAPAYLPYFVPPRPVSSRHCVVVVSLAADLGIEAREAVSVSCQLAANDQMIDASGEHLGQGKSSAKSQTTNAFGLAFFQCWKTAGRVTRGGTAPKSYLFNLDGLAITAGTIPDQDWVLLEDIANV